MSAANDAESARKFYRASMLLHVAITSFLEQHPPDCAIADFIQSWVHDVASNLRIDRLAFNDFPLFTVAAMESVISNPALVSDASPFVISDFPHRITLCSRPPKGVTSFLERLLKTEMKMRGLMMHLVRAEDWGWCVWLEQRCDLGYDGGEDDQQW
ncbi:hypothetical protein LR48_Vigan06g101600 [Vigna angularis]|uniref:Uncharacterized protein n=1 Tax=Phaseolus angularis TaxID=3914 RepID=A0A0L9US58_PHAAN|nr:hypothetical protein LR48_Vigan06g101600 [Vigna angularis]